MKEAYIIEQRENGVLVFTMNREEKRNAVDYKIMAGLEKVLQLATDDDVKVLIITGAGEKAFCSGGDLSVFHGLKTEAQAYEMLKKMSDILYSLVTLPKPTIAIMNGAAVGGGCEIATCCDYRFAREGIKAGFVQADLAITTGWGGGTVLIEKMTHSDAMTMLMGAKIYNTDELTAFGFLDGTYTGDGVEVGIEFTEQFVNKQTGVLIAYKQMNITKWELSQLKQRMEQEVRHCAILWEQDAHHEAVTRFLDSN